MEKSNSNVLLITTPEGVSFPLYLAGPVPRSIAWIIDIVAILLIMNIASQLIKVFSIISPELNGVLSIFLYFIVSLGYGITFEWLWRGKTLGKYVMKLKVTDQNGLQLDFNQIFIRNLMRVIDIMPFFYCLGGTICLASRHHQRLGDMVAQTVVTRSIKIGSPDLTNILPDKYNSLKNYPQIISKLKNTITPNEIALLSKAILRRESLNPKQRNEIYMELVDYILFKVKMPQEVTDGLSHERLIRNVLHVFLGSN